MYNAFFSIQAKYTKCEMNERPAEGACVFKMRDTVHNIQKRNSRLSLRTSRRSIIETVCQPIAFLIYFLEYFCGTCCRVWNLRSNKKLRLRNNSNLSNLCPLNLSVLFSKMHLNLCVSCLCKLSKHKTGITTHWLDLFD